MVDSLILSQSKEEQVFSVDNSVSDCGGRAFALFSFEAELLPLSDTVGINIQVRLHFEPGVLIVFWWKLLGWASSLPVDCDQVTWNAPSRRS
jgi:hypothetical protein